MSSKSLWSFGLIAALSLSSFFVVAPESVDAGVVANRNPRRTVRRVIRRRVRRRAAVENLPFRSFASLQATPFVG